ncbi:MAG: molybdopterin molybdotransferase MoeA [Lysobacterales bacterium]
MLTVAAARAIIVEAAGLLPAPTIEAASVEHALHRVLARDVAAPRAVPGFACSAMDGYALRRVDLTTTGSILREDGATLAGATAIEPLAPNACRRITTGAPLPDGADTVVMHEQTRRIDESDVPVRIEFKVEPQLGANVRSASDDFASGHRALLSGTRLDAVAIATAVTLGFDKLQVRSAPSVAIITTGDELLPAGAPWQHGLRYDSNGILLAGLLADHGIRDVIRSHVRDDQDALRDALREAASAQRLIIVTGGVSAGEADYLPRLCTELGTVLFWKLRFRPGMPALFARIGESLVFGLPGNPVSVLATFVALVRPMLARWMDCAALDPAPTVARLTHSVGKRHDRLEWRRGNVHIDAEGTARVTLHPSLSSGALRSLVESNALVELAAERSEFGVDALVPVRRWTFA